MREKIPRIDPLLVRVNPRNLSPEIRADLNQQFARIIKCLAITADGAIHVTDVDKHFKATYGLNPRRVQEVLDYNDNADPRVFNYNPISGEILAP
jgi:hypothetical protein